MFFSTKAFFVTFARHMASGMPVVADCDRHEVVGRLLRSPIGSVPDSYSSPAFLQLVDQLRRANRLQRLRERVRACFASRLMMPAPTVCTFAIGSPVAKWLIVVNFERLVRLAPTDDG